MIQLNLLPDVKREYIEAQRSRNTAITICIMVMLGSLAVIALLFVYLNVIQRGQNFLVDRSIDENSAKLQKVEEIDKYLTVQNQLIALPDLHNAKTVYSRLFAYLPVLNPAPPNNVALSKVTIDEEMKTISIEGSAANFAAVNTFKNTLDNAKLQYRSAIEGDNETKEEAIFSNITTSEVGISEAERGASVVRFKASLSYSEQAFANTITDAIIKVPSLNATNSVQHSPGKIFGGNPN